MAIYFYCILFEPVPQTTLPFTASAEWRENAHRPDPGDNRTKTLLRWFFLIKVSIVSLKLMFFVKYYGNKEGNYFIPMQTHTHAQREIDRERKRDKERRRRDFSSNLIQHQLQLDLRQP